MRKLLLLVAATFIVAVGCLNPAPPPSGPESAPLAVVVGDSLIVGAETEGDGALQYNFGTIGSGFLTNDLHDNGYRTSVAGTVGSKTSSLNNWSAWSSTPDIVVIALGTNDMRDSSTSVSTAANNVTAFLNRYPTSQVVFVGIAETTTWGLNKSGPAWNSWLKSEALRRGGTFVDWAPQIAAHLHMLF